MPPKWKRDNDKLRPCGSCGQPIKEVLKNHYEREDVTVGRVIMGSAILVYLGVIITIAYIIMRVMK